ncbi:MAG: hypothetical protein ACRDZR_11955 [Acidimicrobiales bacterium]
MDLPFLRRFNAALDYRELDPDTEEGQWYYVPLHGVALGEVGEVQTHILLSASSVQGVTGPSGSGKSTELLRLRRNLEAEGCWVAYVDTLRYLSETSPLGIVDFLIALALGVVDAHDHPDEPSRVADLWERIKGLRVNVSGATVGVGPVVVDLKAELKSNESFVQRLRAELEPNLAQFTRQIQAFIAEQLPAEGQSVVIVDQTEKISGTPTVHESIRDVFLHHGERLQVPGAHVVYTLPPYLPILATGILKTFTAPVRQVLSVTVRDRASGEWRPEALDCLRTVVARRQPAWERLVTPDDLDRVLRASGGQLRDLFLLLREVIAVTVTRGEEHPVDPELVSTAIGNVRSQFGLMTAESAELLEAIRATSGLYKPPEAEILKVADLLQTHVLLVHRNGAWWWEIHPLADTSLDL